MSDHSKAFLDAVADCDEQCRKIREALQIYSDKVEGGVDQDALTHAIAWRNGLHSYLKIIELVTKHGSEPEPDAPECSIKPPTQQCSI